MSLFSTLQLASNALQANSIGLQVVGQNIANVNTPGYARSELVLTPAPTQRIGNLLLGLGVRVDAIQQVIDEHLNERLRNAIAENAGGQVQKQAYQQLEGIIGELQDTDISTSLNRFFSSISQILTQPESVSARNQAVLQGKTLAADIGRLASRVRSLRADVNDQITELAPDVNRLLRRVAELNVQIATTEGGSVSASDAVGLRDERSASLEQLAKLIDVTAQEQESGAVNIFAGGDFLVFEGTYRQIEVQQDEREDFTASSLVISETDSPLQTGVGKVAGLIAARDDVLGAFLERLDEFTGSLAFEFNKVFASGQGLSGYSQITSERGPTDPTAALDAAGLPFTPVNGSFDVLMHDKQTDLTTTTRIQIDLNGLDGDDTTFANLVAQLDAIDGLAATTDVNGRLILSSESPNVEFAFSDDTSGVLAALGVNTFFTGSTAGDLGISQVLLNDPSKFTASRSGIDGDTQNAVELAAFLDRKLDSADGKTLGEAYSQLVSQVTQGSAVAKSAAAGFQTFEDTLRGQQLALSGVNIDEEAVNMMSFQRAFQATAKLIQTINDILSMLSEL